jgi:hypothetical protein
MSDDDTEKARKAGEEWGVFKAKLDNALTRIARMETAVLGVIGAVIAAWAKSKGLW